MHDVGETQLVKRCKTGDEQALREMVRRFEGVVYGVSYRILKDTEEARDAAQESLIKALKSLDTFEPGRKLRPWIAKIAWNHAIRQAAKRHKNLIALEVDGADNTQSELPDPAQIAEQKEMGAALLSAMNQLPMALQVVLEMRCGQGMDYRQIAQATGWPIGTVKTNLFRARSRLMEMLSELKGETS